MPTPSTLVGEGLVDAGVPYAEFLWSNWCGADQPPYSVKALGKGKQAAATGQLAAGPQCADASKPSAGASRSQNRIC